MRELPLPAIPSSWSWAELGDVLNGIEAGKSFKCEERPPKDTEVGIVKVSAVTWGKFDEDASKTCLSSERIDSKLFIQPGDFLFSRANTIQLVGACVIVQGVSRGLMLSDKILRFRLHSIAPQWLLYVLRTAWGRAEIERLATGNQESMRNIGQDRVRAIRIPLPPLAEQRRIVDEIEKQFTRLDCAVSALKAVMERVQAYSRATLNSLTRAASRDCAGWAKRSLNELSDIGTGVTPLRSNDEFWRAGTIPWVTSTAVNRPFIDEPQGFVTEVALKRTNLKVYSPGTLLIAMYGEGKTRGKVSELRISAAINQALAAVQIRPQWGEYREYTKLALTSAYDQIRRRASGGVQPNLNLTMIGAIEIWLPPQSEVARITSDLSAQVTDAAHMQSGVAVALARAVRLRQAILKKAFEGKLVPQDPNDEPASVLLQRISRSRLGRRRRDVS